MFNFKKVSTLIGNYLLCASATGSLLILATIFVGFRLTINPNFETTGIEQDIESVQKFPMIAVGASDLEINAARLGKPISIKLTTAPGDTLIAMLVNEGIGRNAAHEAVGAMSEIYKPHRLKPEQEILITARLPLSDREPARLLEIELAANVERSIVVTLLNSGIYQAKEINRPLFRNSAYANGSIQTSLYNAALDADVPLTVLANLIQIFSFDVDFQRDIRRGDMFSMMYSYYSDQTGTIVRYGEIDVASMTLRGKESLFYRFITKDGKEDFYDNKGHSARKALLRTPIDGARLSSKFGMRRHPILGYNKMHRGLDFAAPTGTPVYSAGNGIVERASRYGAYGKYVRVRHNGTYKTAYAHLSRYGKGVRSGGRVQQGQIIGYVGTTGRSTGAHLHYEVLVRNSRINPHSLKLPTGRKLKGTELINFNEKIEKLKEQYLALGATTRTANSTKALVPTH